MFPRYIDIFFQIVLPRISAATNGPLDEKIKDVLAGELTDLPKLQPTTVRIYLSSNEKGNSS